jgi:uncharacterized protein (DUF952 family)
MLIYKICDAPTWRDAERKGAFEGLANDRADGFIHMSNASEVRATLAKYFAGQHDLVLVAVDRDAIADTIKDEPSRGGVLFPHIYGVLPMDAVVWCEPIVDGTLPARFKESA